MESKSRANNLWLLKPYVGNSDSRLVVRGNRMNEFFIVRRLLGSPATLFLSNSDLGQWLCVPHFRTVCLFQASLRDGNCLSECTILFFGENGKNFSQKSATQTIGL
jgi:hypothetical protein